MAESNVGQSGASKAPQTCRGCDGKGWIEVHTKTGVPIAQLCPVCNGKGVV